MLCTDLSFHSVAFVPGVQLLFKSDWRMGLIEQIMALKLAERKDICHACDVARVQHVKARLQKCMEITIKLSTQETFDRTQKKEIILLCDMEHKPRSRFAVLLPLLLKPRMHK
ncbi:hypothetical protein ACMFMF_001481 [Clarireedia jacksonii]